MQKLNLAFIFLTLTFINCAKPDKIKSVEIMHLDIPKELLTPEHPVRPNVTTEQDILTSYLYLYEVNKLNIHKIEALKDLIERRKQDTFTIKNKK